MSKKELIALLNKTSEVEKLLTPMGGSFMPTLKTINGKVEFQIWKEELKLQLGKLKKDHIIIETLELLDTGFQNGFTDEKDFTRLQGMLKTISSHINDFFDEETEEKLMVESQKLKKGTKIKTAFDEYTLIGQVGSGGNGRVFSAKNKSEEDVAIKFVEQNIDSKKLKRFKNEIHFCEHHKHDNIVRIIDRGYVYLDNKDYVFYVMPLYKDTLKSKIKEGIPHDKILDIFIGLLKGLKYAHEHDSIHRDIKPENIMFSDESWNPVICDFGIAHFAEEDLLTVVETKITDRMANFQYSAPEQRQRGGNICYQTDIYALALILNEMFTSEIPQGVGYKTIKDVNSDFEYLDALFIQMFNQNPIDRLYPEDAILSELKFLAEQHKHKKEAERLKSIINEIVEPEDFNPSIINIEYENKSLLFTLDCVFTDEWFQLLKNGNYIHSCYMGYDTFSLKKVSKNQFAMPIRGSESQSAIKQIVEFIKNWVKTVSKEYSLEAKRQAIAEQRRKEEARIAERNRIEKENEIRATINDVLKDLL